MAHVRPICYSGFEMNIVKYLIITAIVFLVVPVVGCSERNHLREVTTKAVTATSEAQSYRTNATTQFVSDGEILEWTFESEFAAPDRSREKGTSDTDWHESVFIGDEGYSRSSDYPEWCQSPCERNVDGIRSSSVGVVTALDKLLEPLNWLVDLEELPGEEIDGVELLHYRGKVDQDSYVDMVKRRAEREYGQTPEDLEDILRAAEDQRRWKTDWELWVGKYDYLIRQLKNEMSYPVVDPNTGEEKWITGSTLMRFYDFNKPIDIELPQLEAK